MLRNDQFPFILMVILALVAIVLFWSIMDMILLGASLAIVLMPLHDRISRTTHPLVAAILVTAGVVGAFSLVLWLTFSIFSSNADVFTAMFTTIGNWINATTTNPTAFGIPLTKASLTSLLNTGNTFFVNYQETLIDNLTLIVVKAFIFFLTLTVLLLHGEEIKQRILERLPPSLCGHVNRLTSVTVDTLYAIYVVQVAIAVLTFFIAMATWTT
jgi:predicted PurR-regulated permease PerM